MNIKVIGIIWAILSGKEKFRMELAFQSDPIWPYLKYKFYN